MTTTSAIKQKVQPSRLGHANMFVADVARSTAFYNDVAGIELVRREPEIFMAFHSNGNTHHDVGLVQVAPGERLGIDGFVQVSSNRATRPGLNHLGWEMHSEAVLLDAFRRLKSIGYTAQNVANHQISHAGYIVDPSGTYHELYADTIVRWRDVFNLEHEELVSEAWDWENAGEGRGPMPQDPTDRRRVDAALFHPRRITHATLAVRHFDETLSFLSEVAGLDVSGQSDGIALLHGSKSPLDLVLLSAKHVEQPGLRAIAFEVESEDDLTASANGASARGVEIVAAFDLPHKRSYCVVDPDGVLVEFSYRSASPAVPDPKIKGLGKFWPFAA